MKEGLRYKDQSVFACTRTTYYPRHQLFTMVPYQSLTPPVLLRQVNLLYNTFGRVEDLFPIGHVGCCEINMVHQSKEKTCLIADRVFLLIRCVDKQTCLRVTGDSILFMTSVPRSFFPVVRVICLFRPSMVSASTLPLLALWCTLLDEADFRLIRC